MQGGRRTPVVAIVIEAKKERKKSFLKKRKSEVAPRFELGLLESKSSVITTTLRNDC